MTPSARQIDAKNSVPCRAAPNAIAAAPHQAIPRRWRTAGARTRRTTATSTAGTVDRSPRLRVLVGQRPRARPRGVGLARY